MHEQHSRGGRREVRFFVDGRAVGGEAFWEAVRALGGRAPIEALDPEPRYRPTPKGEAAARGREGRP